MTTEEGLPKTAAAASGLVPPVVQVPAQGCTFENVTVVNPGVGREAAQKVVVGSSLIDTISDFDGGQDPRSEDPYAGSFLLPGLIDMHVHYNLLPEYDAGLDASAQTNLLFLQHGVTGVREMGGLDSVWDLRERMKEATAPGPRLFLSAKMVDGDPPRLPGFAYPVRTPAEARQAVADLAERGVDFIKVYDFLSKELLDAIHEAVHEHGLRAVGHLPVMLRLDEASMDEIQHLWMIQMPNPRERFSFNNPADFAEYYVAWAGLDDRKADEIIRVSLEKGISYTPTISCQDRISRMQDPGFYDDPAFFLGPRSLRDGWWSLEYGLKYLAGHSEEELETAKRGVENIKKLTGRMYREGITVFCGTDTPAVPGMAPGACLHDELRCLVDSGLTAEEAWASASSTAAQVLNVPMLGTLKAGAPADMLVFREDPTVNLDALYTLQAVVADGRLYTKAALDEAAAKHRDYMNSSPYDEITVDMVRAAFTTL
jgi:imidazolonepropionase-like amidohydrolase